MLNQVKQLFKNYTIKLLYKVSFKKIHITYVRTSIFEKHYYIKFVVIKLKEYNLFCQMVLKNDTVVVSNCFNKTQIKNTQLLFKFVVTV